MKKLLITMLTTITLVGSTNINKIGCHANNNLLSIQDNSNYFIEINKVETEISDLTLYKNDENKILYTTWTGDGNSRIYQVNTITKKIELIAKLSGEILSLIVTSNQIIYASTTGTGTGYGFLYQVNKNNCIKIDGINGLIESLTIDHNDNIYASNDEGIIYKKNKNQETFVKIMESYGEILTLTVAPNGTIYAGVTYHGAIVNSKIYKSTNGINFDEMPIIINDEINTLIIDKNNNIYANCLNGSVYQCLFNQTKFKKIIDINDKILNFDITKNGNIYLMTWKNELYYQTFNQCKIKKIKLPGEVSNLIINQNDDIYAAIINDKNYKIIKINI